MAPYLKKTSANFFTEVCILQHKINIIVLEIDLLTAALPLELLEKNLGRIFQTFDF